LAAKDPLMASIQQLSRLDRLDLERRLQRAIHGSATLEAAAQQYTKTVYQGLSDSLALLRIFATVRRCDLPDGNRSFVDELAASAGASEQLTDDTLVLSLLGTMGVEPDWCMRGQSKGHTGIPLISQSFVAQIPMIARMLKQLGVDLEWVDRLDTAIVGKTFGVQSGTFYVADAATAVDSHGRKIIAAQEFVTRHGIKTVFGIGGGYVGTPIYVTIIGFCREFVEQPQIEALRAHIDRFKAETQQLATQGRIFAD
jgi:hypothetical protein